MWMYWRYFMWNFVGRENFDQGYFPWNLKSGHWLSGIKPIDEARLYNMEEEPVRMKTDPGRNKYYFIPYCLESWVCSGITKTIKEIFWLY